MTALFSTNEEADADRVRTAELDAELEDAFYCDCCETVVAGNNYVKTGAYKNQCTDCANANSQDDKRSRLEDGR